MLQPLMVEPLLVHSILIVKTSMTGRTQAQKARIGIAGIVVFVCCMQVDGIHRSWVRLFSSIDDLVYPCVSSPFGREVPHVVAWTYAVSPLEWQVLC